VEFRSDLLSEFYGHDVFHRAGVYIPSSIANEPETARAVHPAIYVIPGFGGNHLGAARMSEFMEAVSDAPRAIWIELDPDSPTGHHGFTDSPNHGPRATALVTEFMPYLEERLKLAQDPGGRIVTGHSSGGWASLWLQLQYPEVFGACFSSAPDPVDFRSFQRTNLYEDPSMYTLSDGAETPSYRAFDGETEVIEMTVRQEASMEHAIDPDGGSGEQWDTWEAMFSERDPATGLPEQMFDARTGAIDKDVIEDWQRFDIARLVSADWDQFGPIFIDQVHLAVGLHDSFYLNEAVVRLKAIVDDKRGGAEGSGYILLVEGATHGSLRRSLYPGWWEEMAAFFQERGYE
jgi:pimeloyl-ACP methyl ester carboxylesterase